MPDLFSVDNLPYSLEAEQAVLGCVLKKPECFTDIADKVKADEFYIELNRQIFAEMFTLDALGKKIDPVVINERMKADGNWTDSEGKQYLVELANSVPSTANAVQYANIVREKYYLRRVIDSARQTIEEASTATDDVSGVIDAAEKRIFDIRSGRSIANEPKRIGEILVNDVMPKVSRLAAGETDDKGIETGYKLLDKTLSGFNKGNLIVVGARPAMGKTNIAVNFARNISLFQDRTVVMFSLEMSKAEIAERFLSLDSDVPGEKFHTGELSMQEWKEVGMSVGRYKNAQLYIDDTSMITVPELKSRVRRIPGVDVVIIDYLGLIKPSEKKENRVNEVASITRELKMMAKELGIPVIVCAQLNRAAGENGKARMPVLTDLRESGSIEQDADVVLFLHRDIYYQRNQGEDAGPEEQTADPTAAKLIIAKNRHGNTTAIDLCFDGARSKFTVLQIVEDSEE